MKSIKKKSILLIILCFSFSLTNLLHGNSYLYHRVSNRQSEVFLLKNSGYWNLSPFIIDDGGGGDYNWSEAVLEPWCRGSGTWNDPYVIENVSINGGGLSNCLEITNSFVYFKIKNCTFYNGVDWGLYLYNVDKGILTNNTFDTADRGIILSTCYNNTIKDSKFRNNLIGINLWYSSNITVLNNIAYDNTITGIQMSQQINDTLKGNIMINCGLEILGAYVECATHHIDNSNLVDNKPIYYYVEKSGLTNSDFSNPGQIILVNCTESVISGLNLSGSSHGIDLRFCNNNLISMNKIYNKKQSSLEMSYCFNNTISENTLIDNSRGIQLSNSNNNRIFKNNASNVVFGIELIHDSHNNTVLRNEISDCIYGIYVSTSNNNTVYKNTLIFNSINAYDDGIINQWDNGSIGNYYSDYGGLDDDDDGIGDIPYNITGPADSKDFYPIWDDGFEENPIFINGVATGVGAHNWTWAKSRIWCSGSGSYSDPYIIKDLVINGQNSSSCITVVNSNVHFIIKDCILVNCSSAFFEAGIKLAYVTKGRILNNNCSNNRRNGIFLEYSDNNTISGNTVMNNDVHGIRLRYYCDNNSISRNEVINNWRGIDLYESINNKIANNSVSNSYSMGIHLSNSDNNQIIKNNLNNSFWGLYLGHEFMIGCHDNLISQNNISNCLKFGISINDYSENNDITQNKFMMNGERNANDDGAFNNWDNGTIGNYWDDYNSSDINDDGIGDVPYIIYNTTMSPINQDNFPIWWDAPVISLNSPNANQIFDGSPFFNISIDNGIADKMWYTLDAGLTNKFFSNLTGKIDPAIWNREIDGLIYIRFYINDSRGYLGFAEISVIKDSIPKITINSPTVNEVFGFNAPDFSLTIEDLSPINATWYTLNGGLTNFTFTGLTGFINQTAWSILDDGSINIRFYANDSFGYLGFKDINIIKDTTAPKIIINSPSSNQLFGITAPTFSLTINEPDLQITYYSINGRPNITFTTESQINQAEWNNIGNGTVLITFYAIDLIGNINSSYVIVRKDANIPDITIQSPIAGETFGNTPPTFTISIVEEDLVSTWYTVEGSTNDYMFVGSTGSINQEAWDRASQGEVTITFYAEDRAGNVGSESVIVMKSIPSPPPIPGYNLILLIGVISIISAVIIKKIELNRSFP